VAIRRLADRIRSWAFWVESGVTPKGTRLPAELASAAKAKEAERATATPDQAQGKPDEAAQQMEQKRGAAEGQS
jgi:hypothetical protein